MDRATTDDDDRPCCWICLDSGPHAESGSPLRRECSCRGLSGYAHSDCLARYARRKSSIAGTADLAAFGRPWDVCPNCSQSYRNEVAMDLSSAFIAYVDEGEHKKNGMARLAARRLRLVAFGTYLMSTSRSGTPSKYLDDAKEAALAVIAIIDEMRAGEGTRLSQSVQILETDAYSVLGMAHLQQGTGDGAAEAVTYFTKCRDMCERIGHRLGTTVAESNMALSLAKSGRGSVVNTSDNLSKYDTMYQHCLAISSESSPNSISVGIRLADALMKEHHVCRANRFMRRVLEVSRRVHGADHDLTKRAAADYARYMKRYVVTVVDQGRQYHFEALRYTEAGRECVVRGPIVQPRDEDSEQTYIIPTGQLVFGVGIPVVVTGLRYSTSLNGKIGDLRSWVEEAGCFMVHFEDEKFAPRPVRQEYLKIVFEVPELEEATDSTA